MVTQNIVLNMTPDGVRPKIYVSQKDSLLSRINFYVINEGAYYDIPSSYSVVFIGVKPDKKAFSYACTHTGHIATLDVTEQMTAVPGFVECELRIIDAQAHVVSSINIDLNVERSPISNAVCSCNEYKSIEDAVTSSAANAALAQEAADLFSISYIDSNKSLKFEVLLSD